MNPHPILSYPTVSYLAVSYLAVSYCILLYCIQSNPIVSCCILLYPTLYHPIPIPNSPSSTFNLSIPSPPPSSLPIILLAVSYIDNGTFLIIMIIISKYHIPLPYISNMVVFYLCILFLARNGVK